MPREQGNRLGGQRRRRRRGQIEVADVIARGVRIACYLGDVYESGTREEFEDRYKTIYGRFDKITAPTPGNHDWPNHDAGLTPTGRNPIPLRHFTGCAPRWGVSASTRVGPSPAAAVRWLKAQMRGAAGTCRIAFWHRPYLNAGRHGDQEDVAPLWRAVQGRAAIVLTGHDHNLQHFKRRDGLVELVSGAGGHDLYQSDENDPRLVWDEDDEFGAVRLDLRAALARFAFVDADGNTLHRGRVRCRAQRPY
jgi:3',5'-cyclic AMP phosphodiesterase CpdA